MQNIERRCVCAFRRSVAPAKDVRTPFTVVCKGRNLAKWHKMEKWCENKHIDLRIAVLDGPLFADLMKFIIKIARSLRARLLQPDYMKTFL